MKKFLSAFIFSILSLPVFAGETPARLTWCGMELTITEDARTYMDGVIAKLKSSDERFKLLVSRANVFFPFVEEAFKLTGVPEDLKYIVLQESALQGDAVSPSNAVGFWQFKEETGKDMGLIIDDKIDERKHIFLSSIAAARYFHRLHRIYGNWVYGVIAYNTGGTGAIPYTESDQFNVTSMTITAKTHWYVLKAIAHKVAFQNEVGKAPAEVRLLPIATHEPISVAMLAQQHHITPEIFRSWNLWIRQHLIPGGKTYVYYVPLAGDSVPPPAVEIPEPVVVEEEPAEPSNLLSKAVMSAPEAERPKSFILYKAFQDPDYGKDYVFIKKGQILLEVAHLYNKKLSQLEEWNHVSKYDILEEGHYIRLKPARKCRFHVAGKNETVSSIAIDYLITPEKLRELNNLPAGSQKVFEGQKLYLRTQKPLEESAILVEADETPSEPEPQEPPRHHKHHEKPKPAPAPPPSDFTEPAGNHPWFSPARYRLPDVRTEWVWHTVGDKENIWAISKKYDWPVNLIKKINNLSSDSLSPGQKLKILKSSGATYRNG